jgi:hypothetical protein
MKAPFGEVITVNSPPILAHQPHELVARRIRMPFRSTLTTREKALKTYSRFVSRRSDVEERRNAFDLNERHHVGNMAPSSALNAKAEPEATQASALDLRTLARQ